MTTLTTTQVATLPRVNLLPPELAEQQRLRRLQMVLGAGVLASVGVVGALALLSHASVSSAQDELNVTKAQGVSLQSQVDEYANVPVVYAQVDAAQAQLGQAMDKEVRWSYFLNDVSLRVPHNVWLTEMTVTENVDDQAQALATAAPDTTQYIQPDRGLVTFKGVAMDNNDIAAWLEHLARIKGYSNPYFTKSSGEAIGDKGVVEFDSQLTVTDKAFSERYTEKAGS
jgi:Tfp pilus assembly protein PilN